MSTWEQGMAEGRAVLSVSGQDTEHATSQRRTRAGICKVPVMQYIPNGNTAVPPDSNAAQGIIGDH